MKTLFALLLTALLSLPVAAQEWMYKPMKEISNTGFEKQAGPIKPISTFPGKGKKGVEGWYVKFSSSFVKESLKVTNKEAFKGDYSLQAKTNGQAKELYKGLLTHNPIKVKSPGRYRVSFWMKSSDPNARVKINVLLSKDENGQVTKKNNQGKPFTLVDAKPKAVDYKLGADWKMISRQVVLTKKDIEAGYEYINPALLLGETPNVTYYIDEFNVEYVMKKQAK
ncbi:MULTISPECIES: carbohydrate binding domain-containing protein [Flammeovirga]|uniref:CBM-cenC domain-containing protein n=1 Tax=Flammeovirga agarivorans TaxID=2726742 RepID=A0A7X8XVY2_9BACT|nr:MULTISPECIES: carbohydrate binding domain-containing protein [Flammeovirga]NLR91726.1 hypothetical protein [Flammeovirga agarivorans]